jgi:hypothetical protein
MGAATKNRTRICANSVTYARGFGDGARMRRGSIFFEDSPIFIPMVFDFARADGSAADIPIGMN